MKKKEDAEEKKRREKEREWKKRKKKFGNSFIGSSSLNFRENFEGVAGDLTIALSAGTRVEPNESRTFHESMLTFARVRSN